LRPEPAAFTPAIGGFLCSDCAEPGRSLVSPAAIKVLRVMAAGDLALFRRLKLDEPVLEEVERVLESQLEYHLDARLKSLQFLRRLRRP
jgi:recombinational DNA repair protein (RecF pathway)